MAKKLDLRRKKKPLPPKPGIVKTKVGWHTIKLFDDDKVADMIKRQGDFEPASLAVWFQACADGRAQTVIDVGAYNGLFAISAALMGNHAIAVEGKPELVERTGENARLNQVAVTIRHAAAGNYDGRGIYHMNGAKYSCASSLLIWERKHNRDMDIEVIKLDSLPGVKGKVGAIKIDTEGTEADVVEGALEIIDRDNPVLLIETLDDVARQARVYDLLPQYECLGFLDGRNLHMVHRSALDHA